MNHPKWILFGCIVVLAFALIMTTGCAKQEEAQEGETQSTDQEEKAKVELPAAVAKAIEDNVPKAQIENCLLYTSPSPRDRTRSRMPSSA